MVTSQEILARASELLSEGVAQGAYALDEYGSPVPMYDQRACTFCPVGALGRAAYEFGEIPMFSDAYDAAVRTIQNVVGVTPLTLWGDHTDEGEVQDMFFRVAGDSSDFFTQVMMDIASLPDAA